MAKQVEHDGVVRDGWIQILGSSAARWSQQHIHWECSNHAGGRAGPCGSPLLCRPHSIGSLRRLENKKADTWGGQGKCHSSCRAAIWRGLDHSHWFLLLSLSAACGLHHSGGRCSGCRWLLCGQRGSLAPDDMHAADGCTCVWRFTLAALFPSRLRSEEESRLWCATCYITDKSAFSSVFSVCDCEALSCMLAASQPAQLCVENVVMARKALGVSGNTLLLPSESQGNTHLSRT